MRLAGLIFDMDGTLGDTIDICVEGLRRAAEPIAGRAFSDADIKATFGPSEEGSVKVLAPQDPDLCLDEYVRHYRLLHANRPSPFPGIHALLEDLHRAGVRLGLVTGKGKRTLDVSMEFFGLEGLFEDVKWGCPERACKPDKIREVVEDWGLAPETVGYVGDVSHDVASARAAGVLALSAAWAPGVDRQSLVDAEPDTIFDSVSELRSWILT